MSFILDALKRSERERHRGAIPTLDSQHTELHQRDNSRHWLRYWPAAVLLSAVAAVLWAVLPSRSTPVAATATMPATHQASQTPVADPPRRQQQLALQVQEPPLRNDNWLLSVPSDVEKMKGVKIQLGKVDQEATPAKPPPRTSSAARRPQPAPQIADARTAPAQPAISPPPQPSAPAEQSAATHDRYQGIPHIRQLSPELQRKIPALSFTVHVYDKEPGNRMVRMEGATYREGMQLKPGLRLIEITPDGVVLNNQGTTFWRHIFR